MLTSLNKPLKYLATAMTVEHHQIKHRNRIRLLLLILLLTGQLITSIPAHADSKNNFSVYNVLYAQQENKLTVFSQLDLSLSDELIDAINNGVAVSIVIEYARPYESLLGNSYQTIAKNIFELERHSLSNRYLMRNLETRKLDIFNSIQSALADIGQSLEFSFETDKPLSELAIRCYIDIYRLPGPLRFKAFYSKAWNHDSNWTLWPLNP